MDFKEVILQGIEKRERDNPHERSGKFTPSRMGRCYRYQILERKGAEATDPISTNLLITFDIGTMIHRYIQGFLPAGSCEVKTSTNDVVGYCDYVGVDCVADFKTVGFFQWKRIENARTSDIEANNEQYCYQLMTYAYLLNKPKGYLVFVKKDDMSVRQFEISLSDWQGRIEHELKVLKDYWDLGVVPKGEPRAYGGKECNNCILYGSE